MKNLKRVISLMTVLVMLAAFIPAAFAAPVLIGKTKGETLIGVPVDAGNTDWAVGATADAASKIVLDLANELLSVDAALTQAANGTTAVTNGGIGTGAIKGWAIDSKWKAGAPTAKDLEKLFNKGGVLALTNNWDAKGKKPREEVPATLGSFAHKTATGTTFTCGFDSGGTSCSGTAAGTGANSDQAAQACDGKAAVPGGNILTFEKVEARPKAPKLAVNYLIGALNTAPDPATPASAGTWTLSEKGETDEAVITDLLFVKPAGKKLAASDTFAAFTAQNVPLKGDGNKIGGKVQYFIKYKANITGGKNTPASKESKISVLALGKAPSLKPDYKKNEIKPKAGLAVSIAGSFTFYAKSEAAKVFGDDGTVTQAAVAMPDKDSMPALETGTADTTIVVFAYATAKKPASLPLTITVAPQAAKASVGASAKAGDKKVTFVKELESRLTADDKWGKAKIALNETTTFQARTKNSAKPAKAVVAATGVATMGYTGARASADADIATVTLTYAEIMKNGEGTGKYAIATCVMS